MPNYVTNRIIMEGPEDEIKKVIDFLKKDDNPVDFNNIVQMPESLNMTSGSIEDQAIAVYAYRQKGNDSYIKKIFGYPWVKNADIKSIDELCEKLENENPGLIELGEKYVYNIETYGCSTWYDWCIKNWGTKWNALDAYVEGNTIGFETAWSGVPELISKVSERFPKVAFKYRWADEDFGCNLGEYNFKVGVVISSYIPDACSEEAYEMAADILGYDAREYWEDDEDDEDDE